MQDTGKSRTTRQRLDKPHWHYWIIRESGDGRKRAAFRGPAYASRNACYREFNQREPNADYRLTVQRCTDRCMQVVRRNSPKQSYLDPYR